MKPRNYIISILLGLAGFFQAPILAQEINLDKDLVAWKEIKELL